jgi:DNA-binding HxlR family transcriptional regulator
MSSHQSQQHQRERRIDLLRSESNRAILLALRRSPSTEAELRGWLVLRGNGKLRRHLETLTAGTAIERRAASGMRRRVEYRLTAIGDGLFEVMTGVHRWLDRHPDRDLGTLSPVGWRAYGLMVDAWGVGVAKLLARGPSGVAELSTTTGIRPERLRVDLAAMQGAGIIAGAERESAAYVLTEWGVLGIGVLALGSRYERAVEELPSAASVEDALTALSATLPLARPAGSRRGACSLTVEPLRPGDRSRSGAIRVEVEGDGIRVMPTAAGQPPPAAWLRGTIDDWLAAVVDGRVTTLRVGGDHGLGSLLLSALHEAVYEAAELPNGKSNSPR